MVLFFKSQILYDAGMYSGLLDLAWLGLVTGLITISYRSYGVFTPQSVLVGWMRVGLRFALLCLYGWLAGWLAISAHVFVLFPSLWLFFCHRLP